MNCSCMIFHHRQCILEILETMGVSKCLALIRIILTCRDPLVNPKTMSICLQPLESSHPWYLLKSMQLLILLVANVLIHKY